VVRVLPARCEDDYYVRLLCDFLQRGMCDFKQPESGGEIDFDIRSGRAGGVGGEKTVRDAKTGEPG
jgi:hypothetical protein